ncbi:MAG: ImmA/IrrE family metallo-endopeptidase [Nitrosomonadales bacterium]|nr:ImmA/IrrE family metallo-endopeptidase [Nitrosomonadales bacterium]
MSEKDLFGAAGQRLTHFEDCRSAIDQLYLEAFATQGSQAFDDFLDFVVRFSNLSVYNAMLVRVQRPGAAAVATRHKWAEFGRKLKPDAVPIVILRPFGPVSFVFEQGDTDGKPLPGENESPLFATGKLSQDIYDQTRLAAEKYGIKVEQSDSYGVLLAGTAAGFGVMPEKLEAKAGGWFRVRLNSKHDLPTRFCTLAHELGHIYCGHVGGDSKGRWPDRRNMSRAQAEMEAEAVAWLVCQRNGVKTKSREYLNEIVRDVAPADISMYAIFEAANRVESRTAPAEKK